MAQQCCPTCGRAIPKPKTIILPELSPTATIAERFAYYKRTAPIEDVRFALRPGFDLPLPLRERWQTLLELAQGGLSRAEVYRRLGSLQADWRRWTNGKELAS